MHKSFLRPVALAIIIVGLAVAPRAASADVLLSSFENNLSSSIGVDWILEQGIVELSYGTIGATEGSFALNLEHPVDYTTDFRLNGDVPLAELFAAQDDFVFDATSLGGPETPEEGPEFRQVFVIVNSNTTGFFQTQIDFASADFGAESLTEAVTLSLTEMQTIMGVSQSLQQAAQSWLDAFDGVDDYWQVFLTFQGSDFPFTPAVTTIIDNVRFVGPVIPTDPGDFDNDGDVDGRDFLLWQRGGSPSPFSPTDLATWQGEYGMGPLVSNLAAVPEPATALLLLGISVFGCSARTRGRVHQIC